eukprot:2640848-Rhodomonas_salina.2
MSGTQIAYAATRCLYGVSSLECSTGTPTSLRACCAMSGTGVVYGAVFLRASYAMPGTERAYGALQLWYPDMLLLRPTGTLSPYALATGCPVLTLRMASLLQAYDVPAYALSGTEIAYQPTCCAVLRSRISLRAVRY